MSSQSSQPYQQYQPYQPYQQSQPYQPSQQSQSGLGDEIYSGAASFGVIRALIGAIIATVAGIIMIIIGISMFFKKINTFPVNATILNINCTPQQNNQQNNPQNNQQNRQNCNINVSYNYKGTNQNKYIQYLGNTVYSVNQTITVYVNTDNESDVYLEEPSPKAVGSALIIFGLIILIGGWFIYWLSKRYKFLAEGISGAYSLFRN